MATDVSICSNACLMLGADEIASLSPPDNTKQAKICANLYPQVRQAILRSHNWHVAKKRVVLAPVVGTPPFDWGYAFNFPDDWLRTIQVGRDGDAQDYICEGRQFLCDDNVLYLVYVFNNTSEATYDSMLVHCLTLAMKAALAYPITKSQAVADSAAQELRIALAAARNVDGQDEPPQTFGDMRLLAAGLANSVG